MNCQLKFANFVKLKISLIMVDTSHFNIFCIFSGFILILSLLTI